MATPIFKDNKWQVRFEEDGYVVVPFIDSEAVKSLAQFCEENLDYRGHGFYHVFKTDDLLLRKKINDKIKSEFDEPMKEILNESSFIYGSFTIKEGGEEGIKDTHQDWSLTDETKYPTLTLWCPLLDVDFTNGCLGVFRSSHNLISNIRGVNIESEYKYVAHYIEKELLEFIPMKAGEAMILNSRLLHYSPINQTSNPRIVAACVLAPRDNPELRFYYRDCYQNPSKIEAFEVDRHYLINKDYSDSSYPVGLKSLAQVDYEYIPITRLQLSEFVNERDTE